MNLDAADLATVVEAPDPFSAEAIAAVLRDAKIDAVVARHAGPGFGPMLVPKARTVAVRVRSSDLAVARRVLAENAAAAAALNWNEVDVNEPADGDGAANPRASTAPPSRAVVDEIEPIPPRRRRMPLVVAAGWLVAASIVVLLVIATAMALITL